MGWIGHLRMRSFAWVGLPLSSAYRPIDRNVGCCVSTFWLPLPAWYIWRYSDILSSHVQGSSVKVLADTERKSLVLLKDRESRKRLWCRQILDMDRCWRLLAAVAHLIKSVTRSRERGVAMACFTLPTRCVAVWQRQLVHGDFLFVAVPFAGLR